MMTAFVVGATLVPLGLRASDQERVKQTNTSANRQLVYSSPEAALDALLLAFKTGDEKSLVDIFGHEHENLIVVTDKVARGEALARLYEASQQKKTPIGAAVGTGIGYINGNEEDKDHAKEMSE